MNKPLIIAPFACSISVSGACSYASSSRRCQSVALRPSSPTFDKRAGFFGQFDSLLLAHQ